MRVLLVEDNDVEARAIARFLGLDRNWHVQLVGDAISAAERLSGEPFDVVVVDWNLGEGRPSGLDLCRRIRVSGSSTALIMLTGRDAVDDKLDAFDAGANDYIVKPVDVRELAVRIREAARRVATQLDRSTESDPSEAQFQPERVSRIGRWIVVGSLKLDPVRGLVESGETIVQLSKQQASLLAYLMENAGKWVSLEDIRREAIYTRSDAKGAAMRVLVRDLRVKLHDQGLLIRTAPKGGAYSLAVQTSGDDPGQEQSVVTAC